MHIHLNHGNSVPKQKDATKARFQRYQNSRELQFPELKTS